ncbi:MAG: CapA family protein [Nanoarchaeota archaeon]|nr:CapA family protein [Nanoarchaeota archaeon]
MKYWAFVFFLSLGTFGLSGFLYFKIHGQPVSTTNAPPVVLASEDDIELLFTGDIMLSRSVESKMRERGDYAYPFRLIAEATRGADITFGNLEGPISDQGAHQGSIYSFRADPRVLAGLNFAGFDVLSLANNHIWDWGVDALLDTVRLLKEAGISSVGAGKNQEEADKPAVFCVAFGSSASKLGKPSSPGCRFRVAFLAYTNLYPEGLIAGEDSPGISDPRLENIRKRVGDAREEADIVIVSFHWGEEYKTESNDIQKKTRARHGSRWRGLGDRSSSARGAGS